MEQRELPIQSDDEAKPFFPRPIALDKWIVPIDIREFHGDAAADEFERLRALKFGPRPETAEPPTEV